MIDLVREDPVLKVGLGPRTRRRRLLTRDLMLAILGLAIAFRLVAWALKPVYEMGWIVARLNVPQKIQPPFGSSRTPLESREAHIRELMSPARLARSSRLPGGSDLAQRLLVGCNGRTNSILLYLKSTDPIRDGRLIDSLSEAYARDSGAQIAHRATTLSPRYPFAGVKLAAAVLAVCIGVAPGVWSLSVDRRQSTDRAHLVEGSESA